MDLSFVLVNHRLGDHVTESSPFIFLRDVLLCDERVVRLWAKVKAFFGFVLGLVSVV
jgi:hypothetical protein